MKTTIKNLAVTIIFLLAVVSLNSSCKKSDGGGGPNDEKFPLTNFGITVTGQRVNGTSVYISYDVKNVSTQNYQLVNFSRHPIYIKLTITTTDGTTYQESRLIPDLEPNRTSANEALITMSSGKVLDPSKTKYELYYEH